MISRKRWSGTYTRTSQRTGFCKSTSKNRSDGYTKCGEAGSGRRDGPQAAFKDVGYRVSYPQWHEMKTCKTKEANELQFLGSVQNLTIARDVLDADPEPCCDQHRLRACDWPPLGPCHHCFCERCA